MSLAYFIKRLAQIILIMAIVLTLNFFLPRVVSGDPARHLVEDPRLTPEMKQEIRAQYGLDKPLFGQFLTYLAELSKGNLGISFSYRRPVIEVIASKIPWTLVLTVSAKLISIIGGILYGCYAAWKRGRFADSALLSAAIVMTAVPSFWFAMILILIFGFTLRWLPPFGMMERGLAMMSPEMIASVAKHAVMPVFTMAFPGVISYAVLVRNSMVRIIGQDFIRTAKAKGASPASVLYRHAFKNATLPLVTSIGMNLAGVIGGAVVIETIFSWDGMGLLMIEASRSFDYPLMQGVMLILSTVTVTANFLTDLVYAKLDPRVKLE
ncbi:MAG TPA: ABC transporter permease [Bacillota bacterium]|nr:ABC transporter permease [Bacillota bacterium]HOH09743.1 ABC transporter permease [Bacillota bacterium]HOS49911.1 ABC transporter permease [Bacillota bacterium]HOY89435.1 ABC transporter permease [Bacillota bacterium]HPI00630.1 ABC transporter permease [Bacillota bacterium]